MFFITSFLYSQNKREYRQHFLYTNLANVSVKENKYKDVLYFNSEINYCDNNGKTEDQAIQTYNLGKIYYDLNRYTDARESFTESTSLFHSLPPTVQSANTYYYLSLSNSGKKNTKQLKFL
jgi:tetratricopeptide (TPR) repeat protein